MLLLAEAKPLLEAPFDAEPLLLVADLAALEEDDREADFDAPFDDLEADFDVPLLAAFDDDLEADLEEVVREELLEAFEAPFELLFEGVLFLLADLERPVPDDLLPPFLEGTFSPDSRASERAIAIACLREVTFLPLPLLSLPSFFSRITFSTFLPAPLEYLAID